MPDEPNSPAESGTSRERIVSSELVAPSDAVRDAVIYKLAKDAEQQFWERIKRPIIRGTAIIAIMLGIIGISAWGLLPGWIRDITTNEIKESLQTQFNAYKDQAENLRKQTVQQLADSEVTAAEVRKKQTQLSETLTAKEQELTQELIKREFELNKALDERKAEAEKLTRTLASLERDASAIDVLKQVDVVALTDKVKRVEELAKSEAGSELVNWTTKVDQLSDKLTSLQGQPRIVVGKLTFREFMSRAADLPEYRGRDQAGTVYEVFEGPINFGQSMDDPIILVSTQEKRYRSGIPDQLAPSVSTSVMKSDDNGFLLRLILGNGRAFETGTIVWVAIDGGR